MRELTYEQAIEELQKIVDELQSQNSTIDQMSENAARAAELIQFCKNKLRHTETQVKHLLDSNVENTQT